MTYEEIQHEVEQLVGFMQRRGFAMCSGELAIRSHDDPLVCMKHRLPADDHGPHQYIWGRGPTPAHALQDARERIAAEKSPHDMRVRHALKQLAKAMEAAKAAGISDDLINPLQVIADRLSKNALESPT